MRASATPQVLLTGKPLRMAVRGGRTVVPKPFGNAGSRVRLAFLPAERERQIRTGASRPRTADADATFGVSRSLGLARYAPGAWYLIWSALRRASNVSSTVSRT